jgi:cytoskeleton protein RodZ
MFQIGDSLREARTRRGLSAADVQTGIRIRERYLTALEEEQWEMLPGEAYTKGFLRTYAEFLGLDGELYIDEYNARLRSHDEEPLVPEVYASSRRPSSTALRTLVGTLVLATAVAGLAAWRLGGSSTSHLAQSPSPGAPAAAAAPAPTVKTTPAAKNATAPVVTPAFAVIRAARGDCWLSVHEGGPHGGAALRGHPQPGEDEALRAETGGLDADGAARRARRARPRTGGLRPAERAREHPALADRRSVGLVTSSL